MCTCIWQNNQLKFFLLIVKIKWQYLRYMWRSYKGLICKCLSWYESTKWHCRCYGKWSMRDHKWRLSTEQLLLTFWVRLTILLILPSCAVDCSFSGGGCYYWSWGRARVALKYSGVDITYATGWISRITEIGGDLYWENLWYKIFWMRLR